jgi:hypothetical protein
LAIRRALLLYSHRNSPKKFTQHQLFACLVLKSFLRTDYRGKKVPQVIVPSKTRQISASADSSLLATLLERSSSYCSC